MAEILITTQPVNQVVAGGDSPQAFTVVANYDGAETLTYQWYSCDADGSNPELIADADADEFTPTAVGIGETSYYFCELDAADVAEAVLSDIVSMQEDGIVPSVFPDYLTGEFVHTYIAQTSLEVQQRFVAEQARTGITIANTSDVLRTAQIELFYNVL